MWLDQGYSEVSCRTDSRRGLSAAGTRHRHAYGYIVVILRNSLLTVWNVIRHCDRISYIRRTIFKLHSMAFLPMGDGDRCALRKKCTQSYDTSGTVYDCLHYWTKAVVSQFDLHATVQLGMGRHARIIVRCCLQWRILQVLVIIWAGRPACTEVLCIRNGAKDTNVS
jgi:hypothetical protein